VTIITISRGSYSKGKEIAEKVAAKLGYECVGRDVLLETSEHFHIPEIKLIRAIHDAPTILDRLGYKKEKFIAFIRAAFLHHMKKDNIVYHGLAGHFFLKGVTHVLKVRIIADLNDRIQLEMDREKISRKEATQILKKDDQERRRWSRHLYGIDTWKPELYDLVIHIRKIDTTQASEIICNVARSESFQATPESSQAMTDLILSSQVKVALIGKIPDADVSVKNGEVLVRIRGDLSQEVRVVNQIKELAGTVKGVKDIHVEMTPRKVFT
jgi:cytidylate kinase